MKEYSRILLLSVISAALALPLAGCGKGETEDHYALGMIALKNEQYPKAIAHLQKAAANKPDDANVLFALGEAHLGNKAFREAIEHFEKGLELDKEMHAAYLRMAEAEIALGQNAERSGAAAQEALTHYLNAQAHCEKALDKEPAKAYFTLSTIWLARRKPERALGELENAIAHDPMLIDAYLSKADLLQNEGKLSEAQKVCLIGLDRVEARLRKELKEAEGDPQQTRLAEIRAGKDKFRLNLIIAYIEKARGFNDRAIEKFTEIIEYAPSPTDERMARFELGSLCLEERRLEAAEEQAAEIQKMDRRSLAPSYLRGRAALERAHKETDAEKRTELLNTAVNELAAFSTQTSPTYLFWLAEAYRRRGGRDEQALTEYRKALSNINEEKQEFLASEVHLGIAAVLLRKGSYAEAESHYRKVLKLRPNHAVAKTNLAHIFMVTGRRSLARRYMEEVAEAEPTSAMAKLQLAQATYISGQAEKALEMVGEAIQLSDKQDPRAYHLQGVIYQAMGNHNEAIASFEEALRVDPSFSAAYMMLAHAHIANNDQDAALELLKKHMEDQPTQPEAPAFLADIYAQLEQPASAIEYYREALSRDPKYLSSYRVARLYLLEGKIDDAIQKWREKLAIAEESNVPTPLTQVNLALAFMLKGETDKALAITKELQQEFEEEQTSFSMFEILVLLYAKEHEEARRALENATDMTTNSKMPITGLIELCEQDPVLAQKALTELAYSIIDANELSFKSATKHVEQAIELAPGSVILHERRALLYSRLGQPNVTVDECGKIIELAPRYAAPHIYLARLHELDRKIDAAISEYDKAVRLDQEAIGSRLALAQLKRRKKQYNEVHMLTGQVIAIDGDNLQAKILQAATLEEQGMSQEAQKVFDEIAKEHPDSFVAKRNLIDSKLRNGRYDEVIAMCDDILRDYKDDTVVRKVKADALVRRGRQGDAEEAIKTLGEALAINDFNSELYVALARIYRANQLTISEAENTLKRGLQRLPGNLRLKTELAETHILQDRLDEAEKLLLEVNESVRTTATDEDTQAARTKLLKSQIDFLRARNEENPQRRNALLSDIVPTVREVAESSDEWESYNAYLLLGSIYLQGYDDKTSATRAFETAKRKQPGRKEADTWLAPIYFKQSQFTNCAMALETLEKNPFNIARLAVSKQAAGNLTAAEKTARDALELPPEHKDTCRLVLANILLDAGRVDEAIEATQKTARIDAHLLAAYEELARNLRGPDRHGVALQLNKGFFFSLSRWPKDVPQYYAAALQQAKSDNIFLIMFLARSLIEARRSDEAAEKLETVVKLQPEYVEAKIDLGRVYELQDRINDAIHTYDLAFQKNLENAQLALRLALLYHSSGRLSDAQKYYKKAIELNPNDATVYYRLARTYEAQGLIDKALEAYDEAIGLAPNNKNTYASYNNAAWHYAVKDKPNLRKALRYALKAKDLSPEQPEIRDTLGWIFFLRGDLEQAKEELETAAMALRANGSVQYHYAAVLAKMGEETHAIRVLEPATDLTFPIEADKKKAQDLLAKLRNTN